MYILVYCNVPKVSLELLSFLGNNLAITGDRKGLRSVLTSTKLHIFLTCVYSRDTIMIITIE